MVIERKLQKGGSSYYVSIRWAGRQIWRRIGTNKAEALQKEALWKRQIEAGTFSPDDAIPASPKLSEYLPTWLAKRKNRTASNDKSLMRLHVLPHAIASMFVAEIRPRHVIDLVEELRAKGLKDKSISNVLGVLRVAFKSAKRDEYTMTQPVDLEKKTLNRRRQKDPEIYQAAECRVLMSNQMIDVRIRMLWTILLCTGMREGEALGRRWGDFQAATGLHALHVRDQYDRQPLKTENARIVPVHPLLAEAMTSWREVWPVIVGREPGPDDFLIPGLHAPMLSRSAAYKALRASCLAVGLPWRSLHSTRHTFITLARRGGADKAAVELITHNARGGIVDGYTRADWAPLCDAVLAVSFDSNLALALPSGETGKNPFLGSGENKHMEAPTIANSPLIGSNYPGFDSRRLHYAVAEKAPAQKTSQQKTQHSERAASSMAPRMMLATLAAQLGILPRHVVSEQSVAARLASMGVVSC